MFRSAAPLLQAQSVAIVGASERARWPVSIHRNLTATNSPVRIYPINPSRSEIWGMPCYPDFASLPEAPDLALVIIPAPAVLDALRSGVERGLKSALIYASEIGEGDDPASHARGAELRQLCAQSGLVVCGPNCMGNVSFREKLFLYPNPDFNTLPPGGVGAVFQSGGALQHWCRAAAERGLRFTYLVSSGNEIGLDAADYIDFMVADPETRQIVLFIEGVRRPEAFKEAARRALAARKPIIAVKVGRTEESRRAALSHTGAIAGDYDVFRALCERYGVVLCPTLDDMIETSLAFQARRLPRGDGLAIVANSGGVVDLLYDYAAEERVPFPAFGRKSSLAIQALVGAHMAIRNPLDCGQAGFGDVGTYMRICTAVASEPRVGMMAVEARTPNAPGDRSPEPLRKLAESLDIPVVAFNRMKYAMSEYGRTFQDESGVPHLQSMPETLRAMKALAFYGARAGRKLAPLPKVRGRKADCQGTALGRTLKAAGLPPPPSAFAATASAAAQAAQRIGFPVALKIVSPQISHKTEVGGVRLDLRTAAEVRANATDLARSAKRAVKGAEISGFLVQKMVKGVEIIVGARDDALYGPVIMVGLGGTRVELVKDVAFRMLPVDARAARAMIDELAQAPLLFGFRGAPPADVDALVAAICGLSRFYLDHRTWIADIEVNPLMVLPAGKGVSAVDIRSVPRAAPGR